MTYTRWIYSLALVLLLALPAWAQDEDGADPGDTRERIESARVAMITTRLNLTSDQARTFWPVYNEYSGKKEKIVKEIKAISRGQVATDAEAKTQIARMFTLRQQELDLEQEYARKLQDVITARQVVLLYKTEREFHRMILRRLEFHGPPPHNRRPQN